MLMSVRSQSVYGMYDTPTMLYNNSYALTVCTVVYSYSMNGEKKIRV